MCRRGAKATSKRRAKPRARPDQNEDVKAAQDTASKKPSKKPTVRKSPVSKAPDPAKKSRARKPPVAALMPAGEKRDIAFPHFLRLPPEIRHQIWQLCLPHQRLLRQPSKDHQWNYVTQRHPPEWQSSRWTTGPRPVITTVSREAYLVATGREWPKDETFAQRYRGCRFNAKMDMIWLSKYGISNPMWPDAAKLGSNPVTFIIDQNNIERWMRSTGGRAAEAESYRLLVPYHEVVEICLTRQEAYDLGFFGSNADEEFAVVDEDDLNLIGRLFAAFKLHAHAQAGDRKQITAKFRMLLSQDISQAKEKTRRLIQEAWFYAKVSELRHSAQLVGRRDWPWDEIASGPPPSDCDPPYRWEDRVGTSFDPAHSWVLRFMALFPPPEAKNVVIFHYVEVQAPAPQ